MERRRFSKEQKQQIVDEALSGTTNKAAVARKHAIHYNMLDRWITESKSGRLSIEASIGIQYRDRIAQLEQMVGRQALEIEFLKKSNENARLRAKQKERLSKSSLTPALRREEGAS